MSFLTKFRLPFRDDLFFSILMLAVFVTPLAFTWQTYEKFETPKIALFLVLVGWAAMVFAWQIGRGVKKTFAVSKSVLWTAAALAVWIIISALHSPTILNGFFGTYPRFVSGAVFYLLIIGFFLLLLLSLTKEKLVFLLHLLMVDAALVAVVGILQSFSIAYYTGLNVTGFQRGPSLLGNPDFSAMFIVSLLPLGLYFFATATKFWQKIYYGLVVFFVLTATILFASRGSWLAAIIGLLLLVCIYAAMKGSKKFIISVFLALLIGIGLTVISFSQIKVSSLSQTFTLSDANVTSRLLAWNMAGQAMQAHPVFGTGPGNFQYFFQANRDKTMSDISGVFDDVHNLFLQFGGTLGTPFLLAFIIILVLAVVSGIKKSWQEKKLLPATLAVSLVTFCLAGCFVPVSSANFVLLAVLLAGLFLPAAEPKEIKKHQLAAWVIVVIGLVSIFAGVFFISSELLFYQGYNEYFSGNFSQSYKLLNVAGKINPTDQMIFSYKTADEIWLGNNPQQVLADTNWFIKLYPLDTRGLQAAANISLLLQEKTGKTSYDDQGVDYAKRLIALDPYNGSYYSRAADYYFADNKLDQALALDTYGLILEHNNDAPAFILLAKIFQLQGKVAASKSSLANAYKLAPDNRIVELMYLQSRKPTGDDYKKIQIPIYFDPSQVE